MAISVPKDHPFASLGGTDNMMVFTTKRYSSRPLVIRGPGAGADVTAAGIFADVIQVSDD
jgi:aspartokinase/homoserine dehydrogenase 1